MEAAAVLLVLAAAESRAATAPPHVVAVVLDTSGSLRPEDVVRARALALGVLERLDPGSEVAVFTFDDESRLVLPRTSSTEQVRRALERTGRTGRFTALHDALYDASRYLRDGPGSRKAILLLTDGRDENSALNLDDGLKVAQEAGMPVFAVGLGQAEERVLRRIAKLTAGQFTRGAEARPETLAEWIRAVPAPAAAGPAAPATPLPAARVRPSPPASRTGEGEKPAGAGRTAWAALGLVAAAAAAGLLFWVRRRNQGPATLESPTRADVTLRNLSDTVISRLGAVGEGEPLDQTVTLRERPILTITKGPGQGQLFELNRQSATSLGRARANDVVLPDVAVSSEHCRIRPEDGRYVLHDLKSTNGTFVNDKRVARHDLSDGDVVQIGETYLEFEIVFEQGGATSHPL